MEAAFSTLVDWSVVGALPPRQPIRSTPKWRSTQMCQDLSEVVPGLLLTCEETAAQRQFMQLTGVKLLITMNGCDMQTTPPYSLFGGVTPYGEYCYNAPTKRCFHVPCDTGDVFVSRLIEILSPRADGTPVEQDPIMVRTIPADDSPCYDITQHLDEVCSLIHIVLRRRREMAEEFGAAIAAGADIRLPAVVVHCLAGISRSSSVVIAYLMKSTHAPFRDVLQFVQDARPVVNPNTGFTAQLQHWEKCGYNCLSSKEVAQRVGKLFAAEFKSDEFVYEALYAVVMNLITTSRMSADRAHFGYLLDQLLVSARDGSGAATTPAKLRRILSDVVRNAFTEEAFVDCPAMFSCIAELCEVLLAHCPSVILQPPQHRPAASYAQGAAVVVLGDDVHEEFMQYLVQRDGADAWVTAEAAVKYLHCVHSAKSQRPDNAAQFDTAACGRCTSLDENVASFQMEPCVRYLRCEAVCFPFPTLHYLSTVAEGFVDFVEWETAKHCPERSLAALRRRFLICRNDGALAAKGTENAQRWSCQFFSFFRTDVETVILQAAELFPDWKPADLEQVEKCVAASDAALAASCSPQDGGGVVGELRRRLEAKCASAVQAAFAMLSPEEGEVFTAKLTAAIRKGQLCSNAT